jgi:TrpR-related protein YerC/YecD
MSLTNKLKDKTTDQLMKAVLSLETVEDCYNFFEDISTISELKSMAQRLEVARLLDNGEVYEQIVKTTRASTATIARVKRCLVYGADGYTNVLNNLKLLEAKEKEEQKEEEKE